VPATTTGGDQGLTLILTLTGGRDGDLVDRHPAARVGRVHRDRTPTDLAGPVDPTVTNTAAVLVMPKRKRVGKLATAV
jgi:hypothetical protein